MEIKTKTRKSRLWKLMNIFFPEANMDTVYMQFNKTIWMPPTVTECPQSMFVHEGVHLRQAGYSWLGSFKWWVKYIRDKNFRYSQELEAYRVQVKWFNDTHNATFQQKHQYRSAIADILASPMYGSIVEKAQAFKELGEEA